MVTGRVTVGSDVTVLDMGYTSTVLLISVPDTGIPDLVAKRVPRYVSGIKASQRNCWITAIGQYLYSSHVKLFKLLCFVYSGYSGVNKY